MSIKVLYGDASNGYWYKLLWLGPTSLVTDYATFLGITEGSTTVDFSNNFSSTNYNPKGYQSHLRAKEMEVRFLVEGEGTTAKEKRKDKQHKISQLLYFFTQPICELDLTSEDVGLDYYFRCQYVSHDESVINGYASEVTFTLEGYKLSTPKEYTLEHGSTYSIGGNAPYVCQLELTTVPKKQGYLYTGGDGFYYFGSTSDTTAKTLTVIPELGVVKDSDNEVYDNFTWDSIPCTKSTFIASVYDLTDVKLYYRERWI